ncbi:hypothetical protein [Embleya sp. AB8]|uniref:hypothetical protein n=1 Tax=Embleya sp. AB8 TaxID=3156304 RepID=UPI003C71A313
MQTAIVAEYAAIVAVYATIVAVYATIGRMCAGSPNAAASAGGGAMAAPSAAPARIDAADPPRVGTVAGVTETSGTNGTNIGYQSFPAGVRATGSPRGPRPATAPAGRAGRR